MSFAEDHSAPRLQRRIAIIGAGPAGLGAAEALREKGYTDITIFEKLNRVGGMSLSHEYVTPDGRKLVYDVGSVQPMSSKLLLRLLKKYGLNFGRGPLENKSRLIIAFSYLRNVAVADFVKYRFGVPSRQLPLLLLDLLKLGRYLWRYRRLARPGFYDFAYWEETVGDFQSWVKERRFRVIGDNLVSMILNLMTFSTQAHQGRVQVYTAFKFLWQMLKSPPRYIDGTYRPVKEGYQTLWIRVAQNHSTVLRADIRSIRRHAQGVTLTTDSGEHRFDSLIISCPFEKIAPLIDATPEESAVFQAISYSPGFRGAFVARHGPTAGIYWYPDTYETGDEPPYLALAIPEGKVTDDTYLYSCGFSHCPPGEEIVSTLQASAENVFREHHKAEITEWVKMHYWTDYSCMFDISMVKAGVFDRIQAMQGLQNTFYAGQLISFSAHSSVVDYSYDLVRLYF